MQWIPNHRLIHGVLLSIFILTMNVKGLAMQTTPCNGQRAVNPAHQAFNLNLAHQAVFSVPDAANVRIACVEGTIWITLDNDPRDIVLEACGVFTTSEHRRAIIYAMKPSQITLAAAAPAKQSRRAPSLRLEMVTA